MVVGGGVILAASEIMGLFVSSDGIRWTNITVKNGLATNDTNSMSQADGRILVGTDAGLSVSDDGGTAWSTSTTADGLGSNVVVGA